MNPTRLLLSLVLLLLSLAIAGGGILLWLKNPAASLTAKAGWVLLAMGLIGVGISGGLYRAGGGRHVGISRRYKRWNVGD